MAPVVVYFLIRWLTSAKSIEIAVWQLAILAGILLASLGWNIVLSSDILRTPRVEASTTRPSPRQVRRPMPDYMELTSIRVDARFKYQVIFRVRRCLDPRQEPGPEAFINAIVVGLPICICGADFSVVNNPPRIIFNCPRPEKHSGKTNSLSFSDVRPTLEKHLNELAGMIRESDYEVFWAKYRKWYEVNTNGNYDAFAKLLGLPTNRIRI